MSDIDVIKFSKDKFSVLKAKKWLKGEGYQTFEHLHSTTKHHKFIVSKQAVGGSVWSELVRHYRGLREAIKGTRKGFNSNMRDLLQKVGDLPITKLSICRRPVNSVVSSLIKIVNTVTDWHGSEYSKLFHLFMVFTLQNGRVFVVEKNQYLNMTPYKAEKYDESMPVSIKSGMTINTLLKQAINKFGDERIYHYRSDSFNCQRFVMDMLEANGLEVKDDLKAFILQDVKHLVPHFAQKIMNVATDLGNRAELAIKGHGPISST
jgi:hypothetical protein